MLTVGSLFSGIGGFDLGLERAGMRSVWFCEQDPFCRRVLARHWPGVPCHPDVRALVADTDREPLRLRAGEMDPAPRAAQGGEAQRQRLRADAGNGGSSGGAVPVPMPFWTPEDGHYTVVARPDVLCGGFPCQDISLAGRGAGLAGERSGLWREFARLIGELRPRYVLVENVPALTHRGLDVVLADLAACGFDAEWDHLPASAFGAPHRRDRIWLVAYPQGTERGTTQQQALVPSPERTAEPGELAGTASGTRDVGDSDQERWNGRTGELGPGRRGEPTDAGWWLTEPDVGRVAHGVPDRVHRLRALGNSLVPQIAEWIGGQIIEWERVMA